MIDRFEFEGKILPGTGKVETPHRDVAMDQFQRWWDQARVDLQVQVDLGRRIRPAVLEKMIDRFDDSIRTLFSAHT